jgi:hypothetical protein
MKGVNAVIYCFNQVLAKLIRRPITMDPVPTISHFGDCMFSKTMDSC